jgi:septum formation protein
VGRAPFLLASSSPRRAALLAEAGAAYETAPTSRVDETPPAGLPPEDAAEEIAVRKAMAAARAHPGRVVLAADTVVSVGGLLLGKPADAADAARMLAALSGREHRVTTGVAAARDGLVLHARRTAVVAFRRLSREEVDAYVATGEPLDKAGAYAIQGGARGFVERLEGARDVVVGLPVRLALDLVARCERTTS